MGFALRCLFFLLVILGLGALMVLYRRRVNAVLLLLLIGYALAVGSRLLRIEADQELLWQSLLAVVGLAVVWLLIFLGERWLRRRRDSI